MSHSEPLNFARAASNAAFDRAVADDVKTIRSEDVHTLFPKVPEIEPGLKLFALHAADGTPIMLTDSREAAIANAER